MFEGLPLRGVLLRLSGVWVEILRRPVAGSAAPAYPAPVQDLLGEMTAAATLMHLNLNYPGSLTLQILGDGPVQLAVAEVQPDLGLRATATVMGEVPAGASLGAMVNLNNQGKCVVTLKPNAQLPSQQPYQGVVPLINDKGEGFEKLSDLLSHYMLKSEQLVMTLVLAADDKVAAGLLIQRLPPMGIGNLNLGQVPHASQHEFGMNEDDNRIAILASSLKREELLTLPGERILHRLFWQEKLLHLNRAQAEPAPHFSCTCSDDRVRKMILGLGPAEARRLVAELGKIEVGCDFCGAKYQFDSVDVTQIFSAADQPPPISAAAG